MHTPEDRLFNHSQTDKCNKETDRRLGRRYMEMAERCGDMEFSLYVDEWENMVEGVANFKYPA